MEQVKKGYINIASLWGESRLGVYSVEFSSFAELENTLHKIELVLKGAEVIEMPTDEELQAAEDNYIGHLYQLDEGVTTSMCRTAFGAGIGWIIKSKIVK